MSALIIVLVRKHTRYACASEGGIGKVLESTRDTRALARETYTVGGATYSVDAAQSSVKEGNEAGDGDAVTSGSVVLTIGEAEYTLDMNLTTSVSTLVGSYTIPFE